MRIAILILASLILAGCGAPIDYRNSPQQQVADFKTCKAGGMSPYMNIYAEIMCSPTEVKP
jgi:uncharacterized protein YcfL